MVMAAMRSVSSRQGQEVVVVFNYGDGIARVCLWASIFEYQSG
jgi:hypothetical protein